MIAQIIGLPGAGKTFLINKYIYSHYKVAYVDFANYKHDEKKAKQSTLYSLKTKQKNVILESVHGLRFNSTPTKIIKVDSPLNIILKRLKERGENLNEDYLSQLESIMLKPDFIVKTEEAFTNLLNVIFEYSC